MKKLLKISAISAALLSAPMMANADVLASVKPLGFIVSSIADGVTGTQVLVPAGASPHDYNFSQNPKRKFSIDAVFSTQPLIFPQMTEGCAISATMNCANGFGAATMITATFGFFAVSRVIDKLLKKKS